MREQIRPGGHEGTKADYGGNGGLACCAVVTARNFTTNEFTAIIEQDGEWFIGWCAEIPEANGQGRTVEECRANLSDAIGLVLEDRREDFLRGVPETALRELVRVA